jgi:hypothetical protein
MTGFDFAALLILILIAIILIASFCALAILPGRIAASRNHPYADAVRVGGWATLFFGGVFWPLILVWAYMAGEKLSAQDLEPGDLQNTTSVSSSTDGLEG